MNTPDRKFKNKIKRRYDYFFSLPEAWISSFKEGLSALSDSLLIMSSWAGLLICRGVGRLCRRNWTSWISSLRPMVWESTRWSAGSCPWVTISMCNTTGWRRSGWKDSQWKRSWWCWLTDAEHDPAVPRRLRRPVASWLVLEAVWSGGWRPDK